MRAVDKATKNDEVDRVFRFVLQYLKTSDKDWDDYSQKVVKWALKSTKRFISFFYQVESFGVISLEEFEQVKQLVEELEGPKDICETC